MRRRDRTGYRARRQDALFNRLLDHVLALPIRDRPHAFLLQPCDQHLLIRGPRERHVGLGHTDEQKPLDLARRQFKRRFDVRRRFHQRPGDRAVLVAIDGTAERNALRSLPVSAGNVPSVLTASESLSGAAFFAAGAAFFGAGAAASFVSNSTAWAIWPAGNRGQ